MAEACDIHGVAFQHGSAVLLARVVGAEGTVVDPSQIASACYSIVLLDESDPNTTTAVPGHWEVPLLVSELLRPTLVRDDTWDVDTLGYNFRHVLNVTHDPAFARAGRSYRVIFALQPLQAQVILVRFRIHVV